MLTRQTDYQRLYQGFAWNLPARYNMGIDTCDRHADGSGKLALIYITEAGAVSRYSFDWFRAQSNRFANALAAHGFGRGDRLAILLPQAPETAIAHLAGALGATTWVALPLISDWRWFWQRDDSPWYPTMRLFRQTHFGNWDEVFERMASELQR